jgi:hypothetical protein
LPAERRASQSGLGEFEDWEDEKASLEIKTQRANARIAVV